MDAQQIISDLMTTMTQAEIAKQAGVSQSYVSSIHTGVRGEHISKRIWDSLAALHRKKMRRSRMSAAGLGVDGGAER